MTLVLPIIELTARIMDLVTAGVASRFEDVARWEKNLQQRANVTVDAENAYY